MTPPYYDHEPIYRKVLNEGGLGWDDRASGGGDDDGSYVGLERFLASGPCPAATGGARALDIGCGGGQVALRLAALGFATTGVDYAPSAIAIARKNATATDLEVEFRVGDALDLADLPDAGFDLVVDNHALHCIVDRDDRRRFMASAARVLRCGGVFFSETMSAEPPFAPERYGIDAETRVHARGNRYWVRAAELREETDAAGLYIVSLDTRTDARHPDAGALLALVARKE